METQIMRLHCVFFCRLSLHIFGEKLPNSVILYTFVTSIILLPLTCHLLPVDRPYRAGFVSLAMIKN